MKKGWEYKTLGEISNFISDGDWIEKKDQSLSGIRLIQTGNIGIGEYKDKPNNAHYISEDTFNKLKCTEIFKNDILISRLPEPLGRSCIMPDLNIRMITAVDCSIVRLKEKIIIPKWFIYYTMSNKYFRQIKEESSGTTRQRITRKKLEKFLIPISDISEQRRIVSYLDSSFDLIDKIKENASKSLSEAKALFQSALAEAMEPKEGWEEKTLGEIATDMYRGSGIKRDQISQIGFPCVRYGEIYTTYNYSFEKCVSHTDESLINPKKYFSKGDILFAITGESVEDIGKCIAYTGKDKCLCGGDIVVMKHNQYPQFLAYALSTKDAIRQKGLGKVKLKVVHTNVPALKSIKIYLPTDIQAQKQIVSRLDSLSSKVRAMEEKYQKMIAECDALKQAMLREVFE